MVTEKKKQLNPPDPSVRNQLEPTTFHTGRPVLVSQGSGLSVIDQTRRWNSCCLSMDRNAARFFALLLLTVFILTFVFYQLIHTDHCDAAPLWGLIGTLIGFWFDSPSIQ